MHDAVSVEMSNSFAYSTEDTKGEPSILLVVVVVVVVVISVIMSSSLNFSPLFPLLFLDVCLILTLLERYV